MKTKDFFNVCVIRLILFVAGTHFFYSGMYAHDLVVGSSSSTISCNGKWEKEKPMTRSLPSTPTASIDGTTLIIENPSQDCDIIISIYDSESDTMYEQIIPASATGYITIPLNGYPSGTYLLNLRNSSGGYLSGFFNIN